MSEGNSLENKATGVALGQPRKRKKAKAMSVSRVVSEEKLEETVPPEKKTPKPKRKSIQILNKNTRKLLEALEESN